MKKAIALLLVSILCLSFSGCGSSKESEQKIEEAQNAINALHKISYLEGFSDSLYLTETAEIHHNEWTIAYLAALDAYNALSSDEKLKIKNADWLTKNNGYINWYEKILIEQEIALYCKDASVEHLKNTLINKSSYEEYGWKLIRSHYFEDDHSFWVELKIEYSATNRMGGRIDDTEYIDCRGTYQDGTITITDIS